jgi:UDP-N-acetylmuramate--alanine ligase
MVRGPDGELGEFHLNVPGFHNVLNATAALAIGLELGVDVEKARQALDAYSGVDRRFQKRGEVNGVTVVDDYGHHPTEIRATLAAARSCDYSRVLVIFQPHRFTRTQHLMDEFARSFHQADAVFLLDIYAASEKPIEGVSADALAERIRQFGHRWVEYSGTIDKAVDAVRHVVQPGDLVLTLGAGNVWQAGDRLLERLKGGE